MNNCIYYAKNGVPVFDTMNYQFMSEYEAQTALLEYSKIFARYVFLRLRNTNGDILKFLNDLKSEYEAAYREFESYKSDRLKQASKAIEELFAASFDDPPKDLTPIFKDEENNADEKNNVKENIKKDQSHANRFVITAILTAIVFVAAMGIYSYVDTTPRTIDDTNNNYANTEKKSRTVYITPTGKRYHRANCRTIHNSCFAISLDDAIDEGYTSCQVCNP